MKKLFVLTTILALSGIASYAQGWVNASAQSGSVFITVQDPAVNGGTGLKIGTTATAAFGTGLGKGVVSMAMYIAPLGTSLQALQTSTAVWTGFNSSSTSATQQGTVNPGNPYQLPVASAYVGGTAVEFIFFGSATGNLGGYAGWSAMGTTVPITDAQNTAGTPANHVWGIADGNGIASMTLLPVPEPATIALGGLGAAALLLFRRRK